MVKPKYFSLNNILLGLSWRHAPLQVLPAGPEHDQRGGRDSQGQGHGRHSCGESLRGKTVDFFNLILQLFYDVMI